MLRSISLRHIVQKCWCNSSCTVLFFSVDEHIKRHLTETIWIEEVLKKHQWINQSNGFLQLDIFPKQGQGPKRNLLFFFFKFPLDDALSHTVTNVLDRCRPEAVMGLLFCCLLGKASSINVHASPARVNAQEEKRIKANSSSLVVINLPMCSFTEKRLQKLPTQITALDVCLCLSGLFKITSRDQKLS